MSGELLLLVDGAVQDSAVYTTQVQRDRAMGEFVAIKTRIEHEKPYAKVTIDERTK